jgi:hypothetical protein
MVRKHVDLSGPRYDIFPCKKSLHEKGMLNEEHIQQEGSSDNQRYSTFEIPLYQYPLLSSGIPE